MAGAAAVLSRQRLAGDGRRRGRLLVNGLPLGTPEEALRVHTELRLASVIVVELERSGSVIRHVYLVR